MEVQTQTRGRRAIRRSHMHESAEETLYKKIRDLVEDSVDIPDAPLPPAFLDFASPKRRSWST